MLRLTLNLSGGGNTALWITAIATLALALAALYALRQLGEIKRDREVAVIIDLGRRWDDPPMTEALKLEAAFSPDALAHLAAISGEPRTERSLEDVRRREAIENLQILLRIPNFFEDIALIADAGGLDSRLLSRTFKGIALEEWDYWQPAIAKLREKDPWSYSQFEWLLRKFERFPDE